MIHISTISYRCLGVATLLGFRHDFFIFFRASPETEARGEKRDQRAGADTQSPADQEIEESQRDQTAPEIQAHFTGVESRLA